MVRNHHIVGALGAAGLLLTGCNSGSTAATPTTSSTSSAAPSSSTSTVAPSSPTTKATPKGDPNVPPAARTHTKAGAKAFVVAYLAIINDSGVRPSSGRINSFSLPGCKTCANFSHSFSNWARTKSHLSGPVFKLRSLDFDDKQGGVRLNADLHQFAVGLLDKTNKVIDRSKELNVIFQFKLTWSGRRWMVAKIYDQATYQN